MGTPMKLLLYLTLITLTTCNEADWERAAHMRRIKRQIKQIRLEKMWEDYFKKTTIRLHKYNLANNDEDLIELAGHAGTLVDPSIPRHEYDESAQAPGLRKLGRKGRRHMGLWWRLISQLPMGRKCVQFRNRFIGQCNTQRRLLQVANHEVIRIDNSPTDRMLRGVRHHKRRHKRKAHRRRRHHKAHRRHKSHKRRRNRRHLLVRRYKRDYNSRKDNRDIDEKIKRQLMGGATAGGMVAGAAPQIDDSRIIIHSFAAPPAPEPNLIRAYSGDTHPQVIQARIQVPPKNFVIL